jgi:hypothetical protein
MPEPLIQIQTIRYKTYVKEALVEALQNVFIRHPDEILAKVHVGVDFPITEVEYPAIVVRFYERNIYNAGVGHTETFEDPNNLGRYFHYKHYLYKGDIEFAVYALSSYDRDILSDALVQIIAMGDLELYSNEFLKRIYSPDLTEEPSAGSHFININTDEISGFGESQALAPWMPEDIYVFQTSYRVNVFGELYSRTPAVNSYGLVEKVETYPYRSQFDPEAKPNPNPEDLTPWE